MPRRSPFANPVGGRMEVAAKPRRTKTSTAVNADVAEEGNAQSMQRLSDKIIAAHEQACQQGKPEVARHLLQALELELSSIGGPKDDERAVDDAIRAAFERQKTLDLAS